MAENSYKAGDVVLYATYGVCEISEITEKDFNGARFAYYALKPLYYDKCTIFVPVGNEALIAKMRPLLSVEEIYALIKAMPDKDTTWIEDESVRGRNYREIIDGGDRGELARLIKTLYLRQQAQKTKNKNINETDKNFMKDAERILYEEFAHVLKIKREQVLPFIAGRIEAEQKARAEAEFTL
jgi:CarD family transcriptional regulator